MNNLKRTCLYDEHVKLGGRMVEFGGWEMPVQYTGVMAEHLACRNAAALFDVSHMGEIEVIGKDSQDFVNYLVTNNVAKLKDGQAQYNAFCNSAGGIVDDLVVYKINRDTWFLVVNASNTDKDFAHVNHVFEAFKKQSSNADVKITNESARYAQIALQGPKSQEILAKLTKTNLSAIAFYHFDFGKIEDSSASIDALIARTGYTGEDGFELYFEATHAPLIWNLLLETGKPYGLIAAGLAARDTLRLEMKYPLYGNELGDDTNPLEVGLGWITKLDKGIFYGHERVAAAKEAGIKKALIGFEMIDRGIARHGYKVFDSSGEHEIGVVTSGSNSPSTGKNIGVAFISTSHLNKGAVGETLNVEVRGQKLKASVVKTPFYKK